MLEQTFASLAILKVNADRKNMDYIQFFVPFVVEAVRLSDHEVISLSEVQERIVQEFGLQIPLNALKTILSRATSEGYITRNHNVYYRKEGVQLDLDISKEREHFLRSHGTLIEKLITFVENRYGKNWTIENAENGLFSYLEKNSGPLLAAAVHGKPLVPLTDFAPNVKDADYTINAFVEHLHRSDVSGFDSLETIVKGRMLADVLLFEDLNVVRRPFNRVEVYFDTQFIMRAIGSSGPSLEAPCTELINLLKNHGAFLRIFDHTYGEIVGILERAILSLKSSIKIGNKRGEALQYFINENLKPSDIEMIMHELPDTLDRLQIKIKPTPPYTNPLGIDEIKLRSALQDSIGYKDPDGEMISNDVASLTAIHRLRGGESQSRIETCDAIFVTSNHSLVRAASRFFQEEYSFSKVPHCILDFVIATLVWLKEPLQTSSDLPHKRIVASCFAAMKPDEYLWKMYLDEADSLRSQNRISDNSLQLAKSSQRIFMDITLGDAMGFTEGTVFEVIDVALKEIRQEEADKLQAVHYEERLALEQRNWEMANELSRVTELSRETEEELAISRSAHRNKIEGAKKLAKMSARLLSWIVVGILVSFILLDQYVQHHGVLTVFRHGYIKYVIPCGLGLVTFLAVIHLIFGFSITEIGRKIEERLEHVFEALILKWKEI